MQKFFNEPVGLAGGEFYQAKWKYAKDGLERNLEKLRAYYDRSHYSVRNEHILVRLLRSIGVNMNMPLDRYYDIVDAKSLYIGRTFKMTSPIASGGLHKGTFYGPGSYEILWATTESFNPFLLNRHWQTAEPIKVLLHTHSDLDLLIPDGTQSNFQEGVSVITINIPMLAVMYRAFCFEQARKTQQGESAETTAMFVRNHLLPSMLPSQLDMSLFNRFLNFARGAPQEVNQKKHAVHTVDYSSYVDAYFEDLLEHLQKSPKPYDTILQLIPGVHGKNMLDILALPDVAMTRQITWAMLLTRLDAIDLLTLVAPDAGNVRNRSDNNYFLREFKILSQNQILNQLPAEVRDTTIRKIKDIEERINA